MKRIFLFVLTNIAVLLVINITLRLLGVDRVLDQSGAINFSALMVMSAVIGFSGSIISLLMSKWMAKRSVGAQVITDPFDPTERWLVDTVRRQAQAAGIGMPEVRLRRAGRGRSHRLEPQRRAGGGEHRAVAQRGLREAEAVLAHEMYVSQRVVTLALIEACGTFMIFPAKLFATSSTRHSKMIAATASA
jgi:heat shock protein HtpX